MFRGGWSCVSSRSVETRVDSEISWNDDYFSSQWLFDTKWSEYEQLHLCWNRSVLWSIRNSTEHFFSIEFIYLFNYSPLSFVQFSSPCSPPSIDHWPISTRSPLGSYGSTLFMLIFVQNQSSRDIAITGVNGGVRCSSDRWQWSQFSRLDDMSPNHCQMLGDCHAQFNPREFTRDDAHPLPSLPDGSFSRLEWFASRGHE